MAHSRRDGTGRARAFHRASSTRRVIWTRSANSHTGQHRLGGASQAGQMAASDRARRTSQFRLALKGASTDGSRTHSGLIRGRQLDHRKIGQLSSFAVNGLIDRSKSRDARLHCAKMSYASAANHAVRERHPMKSFPLAPPTPARRDLADPRSTVAPRNLGAKPTLNDPRSTR